MSLSGWYHLCIISVDHPNPGVGGMYLTLTPKGAVMVVAVVPSMFEHQKWHVQAVDGGTDVYMIEGPIPGCQEGLREGLLGDNTDEVVVVFGRPPEEWRIGNVGDNIYLISPNKNYLIGMEHLVGTDGRRVVVKVFPVVPGVVMPWFGSEPRFEPEPV